MKEMGTAGIPAEELRNHAILAWSKHPCREFDGFFEVFDDESKLLQVFNGSVPLHEDRYYAQERNIDFTTVWWLGSFGERKTCGDFDQDNPKFWSESTGWIDMKVDEPIRFDPREKHCVLAFGLNIFYSEWTELEE